MVGMAFTRPPRIAWAILGLALLGVSSGGPLLASMPEVPPILRASWRLWATSLVLAPGLYVQRGWLIDHGYDLNMSIILVASGIALAVTLLLGHGLSAILPMLTASCLSLATPS